jgi:hypothetical protein
LQQDRQSYFGYRIVSLALAADYGPVKFGAGEPEQGILRALDGKRWSGGEIEIVIGLRHGAAAELGHSRDLRLAHARASAVDNGVMALAVRTPLLHSPSAVERIEAVRLAKHKMALGAHE